MELLEKESRLARTTEELSTSKASADKLENLSKQLREKLEETEGALSKEKIAKRALEDEAEEKEAIIEDLRYVWW